jgi:hypothetical protein
MKLASFLDSQISEAYNICTDETFSMAKQPTPILSLAAAQRETRREQALRDNLHKRKAQSRGRDDLDAPAINCPATKTTPQETTP